MLDSRLLTWALFASAGRTFLRKQEAEENAEKVFSTPALISIVLHHARCVASCVLGRAGVLDASGVSLLVSFPRSIDTPFRPSVTRHLRCHGRIALLQAKLKAQKWADNCGGDECVGCAHCKVGAVAGCCGWVLWLWAVAVAVRWMLDGHSLLRLCSAARLESPTPQPWAAATTALRATRPPPSCSRSTPDTCPLSPACALPPAQQTPHTPHTQHTRHTQHIQRPPTLLPIARQPDAWRADGSSFESMGDLGLGLGADAFLGIPEPSADDGEGEDDDGLDWEKDMDDNDGDDDEGDFLGIPEPSADDGEGDGINGGGGVAEPDAAAGGGTETEAAQATAKAVVAVAVAFATPPVAYMTYDDDAALGKPAPPIGTAEYVKGDPITLGGGKV